MYDIYGIKSRLPWIYIVFTAISAVFVPFDIFLAEPVRVMHKNFFGIEFTYHFSKTGIPYSIWSVGTLDIFFSSMIKVLRVDLDLGQRLIGAFVFLFAVYCAVNDFLTSHHIVDFVMMAEYGFPICIAFVFGYFLLDEGRNHNKLIQFNREIIQQRDLAEKRLEITQAYTRKSIVDKIRWHQDPRDIKPERKNAAVLFADIRSFTSYVEYRDPDQEVNFLNVYFNSMNNVVNSNNGEVDKLIGDGLMAIYNNADNAVRSAIEMKRNLHKIKTSSDQRLKIGIGIGWGEVVLGNIGSDNKMDYTIIGDIVNTSSRIETLTKLYRCDILITEDLYKELKGNYSSRFIEEVRVRGKKEAVKIFEIYDHLGDDIRKKKTNNAIDMADAYKDYKLGEFVTALEKLNKIRSNTEDMIDHLPTIFYDRLETLINLKKNGLLK